MTGPHPMRILLIVGLAMLAGGCAGEKTVVNGHVNLDGAPLGGAQVQLLATDIAHLRSHPGTTDASGKFTIQSDPSSGPIEPGTYLVLVLKYGSKDGAAAPPQGMMGMPNMLPAIYSDRSRTPFKVEIHAGTNDLPPFDLRSKGEP